MNGLYSGKLVSALPTGNAHNTQRFFWPRVRPHSRLSLSHVLGIACPSQWRQSASVTVTAWSYEDVPTPGVGVGIQGKICSWSTCMCERWNAHRL
eukprot:s1576_g15.t1